MISNMRNILKSIEIAQNENSDLFYFLEDDYIHNEDALIEMIYSYQRICSQINDEIVLCPADYPYLYINTENTMNTLDTMNTKSKIKNFSQLHLFTTVDTKHNPFLLHQFLD